MYPRRFLPALCLLVLLFPPLAHGALVRLGVAANFLEAVQELAASFEAQTGHRVVISAGSSGKLYTQIEHGAPYDVLLSADAERPQRLEASGFGVAGSRFTYAHGKLALWSAESGFVDGPEVLRSREFVRLAMANPRTAPYGTAAWQVLDSLGLRETLSSRLVQGDSIAQTFQFVMSGSARLGFVAMAQLRGQYAGKGSVWEVPADLHQPIVQQALLLKPGETNEAAQAFLQFLKTPEGRRVIQEHGYGVPE